MSGNVSPKMEVVTPSTLKVTLFVNRVIEDIFS